MVFGSDQTPESIRISRIAGRFLVFDPVAAAQLRREQNTCGTLVGTVPQQPTQNIFLGLPVELRPEEVHTLLQKQAAYVVDDVVAHQSALRTCDRSAYIESIRKTKQMAKKALAERQARKAAEAADRYGSQRKKAKRSDNVAKDRGAGVPEEAGDSLFSKPAPNFATAQGNSESPIASVTPTTSEDLISPTQYAPFKTSQVPEGPLARFLQGSGYFMTPGLRFGAKYSVYPGDPLRFHAHFMANDYGYDEPIPMLDIVEGGRLATAVKKAFLIGGNVSSQNTGLQVDGDVRSFSIEWAGM